MNNDITEIIAFYRKSNADILCALDGDGAGVLWTFPPASPESLCRAVRQLRRSTATRIQWVRRLRLRSQSRGEIEAFSITILPDAIQQVYRMDNGKEISCKLLMDKCLEVITAETCVY